MNRLPPAPPRVGRPSLRNWYDHCFFHARSASSHGQFRWGRAGLVTIVALVSAYMLLATAGFLFIRHRRHAMVGYADVLVPWRWDRVRAAQGAQLVNEAFGLARTGHQREAIMHLRAGLAQVPAHRSGRLLQAQLLAGSGRKIDEARQLLLDGVSLHPADARYLFTVFSFLVEAQDDATIVALARRLLPNLTADPEPQIVVALAAATASLLRGNYDRADDFLATAPRVERTRDGRLLHTRIEWERGYHELAVISLRALAAAFPDDAEIHHDLVRRLREMGAVDETRRQTMAFQIAHPAVPSARIDLLRAYDESGDAERFAREAEAAQRDFAGDGPALLALADFAATTGKVDLVRRIAGRTDVGPEAWAAYAFLVSEAQIVAGDYHGAVRSLHTLMQDHREVVDAHRALLESLQAVAYRGLGDQETSRMHLASVLLQPTLRADNLLALANRFVALDAAEPARRILARVVAIDPQNQAAVTRLVELDLNLNRIDDLPAHLHLLVALRQPSPDVLRVARHKLGSDLFLFSKDRAAALEAVGAALEARHGRLAGHP